LNDYVNFKIIYILVNIFYFNTNKYVAVDIKCNIFIKHISPLLNLINMLHFINTILNNIMKINYLSNLLNALNNNI